jgi:hypothetical protein
VQIIAFYYYLDVKNKFNKDVVIMTALLTLGFMIRHTTSIGWIPLLTIKVLIDGSFVPFLLAGILVFSPIIAMCLAIDSYYFG